MVEATDGVATCCLWVSSRQMTWTACWGLGLGLGLFQSVFRLFSHGLRSLLPTVFCHVCITC